MKYNIKDLSLSEKVGQMLFVGINSNNINSLYRLIEQYKIGGVILYKKNYSNYEEMLTIIKKLKESNKNNKIPLFIGIDQEGGRVNRLPNEIINIKNINDLASLNSDKIIEESSDIMSKILVDSGININFAPVFDIDNGTKSNVIYKRCFSNDYKLVSKYGIKYFKTMQKNNLIPVIKHFPGHGASKTDSHFFIPYINKIDNLYDKHMIPFIDAINNNCDAIMVGHLFIKNLTGIYPASISSKFINEILRKKLNYKGLIITDDIKMGAVNLLYGRISLKKAFLSGTDLILYKYKEKDYKKIDEIIKLTSNKKIDIKLINNSVTRILQMKEKYKVNDSIDFGGCDIEKVNKQIRKLNDCFNDKTLNKIQK